MRAVSPNDLTPDAPYSVIVSVDNCRFQHLNDKEVEIIREQFKSYDVDQDNFLSIFEVQRMFEGLKLTKTTNEIRQAISEADFDSDSKVNFYEFLLMVTGASKGVRTKSGGNLADSVLARALKAGLADRSLFHASAIESQKDRTSELEAQIRQEAAIRRKELEMRKEAEELEKKKKEEEENARKESRARLAARAAFLQAQ